MTDVLLAHSNFLARDRKQRRKMRPFPPLGTLYAAATLRRAGRSVALFDATFAKGPGDIETALRRHRPGLFVVFEDQFNFISKMCLATMREAACGMARRAREVGAVTLAAGPDATLNPEAYLGDAFDLILAGEAEETLLEISEALGQIDGGRSSTRGRRAVVDLAREIPGVRWREADRVAGSGPRMRIKDLDGLPPPAWDLARVADYREAWRRAHGSFTMGAAASRGCPYTCVWCAKPIWGHQYAARSPDRVAAEMEMLLARYAPDHLWFADDIFGLEPGWLAGFSGELRRRGLRLPFTIQTRADLVDGATVELLEGSGCREVWIGVESGSQRIVDAMGKGHRVVDIPPMVDLLHRHGIRACLFLQFGFPGETFEDIMATVSLVRDAMPSDIGISVTYPMPGTEFYEIVCHQVPDQASWHDSGDLAVLFRGEYSSDFYRHLHSLLHRELDCRNRLVAENGRADPGQSDELRSLEDEWAGLARDEGRYRTSAGGRIEQEAARRCRAALRSAGYGV